MKKFFGAIILLISTSLASGQKFVPITQEEKVPPYTLPKLLQFENGDPVVKLKDWKKRRSELYQVFATQEYGVVPPWHGKVKTTTVSMRTDALGGKAIRKEICFDFINKGKTCKALMLLYLPKSVKKAPLFLSYNFDGNHTTTNEPDVRLPESWVANKTEDGITDHHASVTSRGKAQSRWPMQEIIRRGYGVATIYYGDIDPDFDDGFKNGIHALFTAQRDSSAWGSIAAWAWGYSRFMDYLVKDPSVNAREVIVLGHSRLGKTALWAGVTDKRFAMVISNNSGCGGAALSKRIFGETIGRINTSFPHWFCENFKKYNEHEERLTFDQHELLALIAPRPLYVASSAEDLWADPKGEFLSCVESTPAYHLLGLKGLPTSEMPHLSQPVFGDISYHIRPGKHDITLYDWSCYMDYADQYFKRRP